MQVKCILIAVMLGAGSLVAQTLPSSHSPTSEASATTKPAPSADTQKATEIRPFSLDRPTMTDNWFGLGKAMNELGIDMKYYWNSTFMSVVDGGVNTGGLKPASTYDWFLTLDFDKMGLIPNADMLVQARGQWGYSVNPWTGSTQQVSDDNDAKDWTIYIDQLWYRQFFWDKKIALQIGYLDYQTIVDRNEYANSEDRQFMNEALDNNPLIPTAGMTGLGAALTIKPCPYYTLITGVGDAQRLPLYKPGFSTTFHDEAWFIWYMEHTLSFKIPSPNGPLPGNYRFGMVYDPVPRARFEPFWRSTRMRGDDTGFYASIDQMLFRENEKDNQGLGMFARYGYRHQDIYRANQFWSTGLCYTGLIPTRNADVLGFAVWQLIPSGLYRSRVNDQAGNETGYELYYAISITPWLVLTPDFQYVDNPGGNDTVSHAISAGFRIRVTF